MSLLNQVLQDLEKRDAESLPEQNQLNHVEAVSPAHKKLPLYLITLLFLTGIIAAASYFIMDEESSKIVEPEPTTHISSIVQPQDPITKPAPELLGTENSIASKQRTIKTDTPPIVTAHQINKAVPTQPIKNHTTDNKTQQQPIKSAPKRIKKNAQTNKIKPYKQQRKFSKKLNSKQQAEKAFTLAKKQKNNTDQQTQLRQVLQLNPKHVDARLLLANNLLNMGMPKETAAVLDHGLQLFPQNIQFINFRSQLFLQNKQPQAALNTLQLITPDYTQDEMYLSLLAAAYQQNSDNLHSLQTYQRLLSINPQKAEYWLGFAIAQEKQGNKEQALNAYQHALNKKTLKNKIVSYINQRVSLLK